MVDLCGVGHEGLNKEMVQHNILCAKGMLVLQPDFHEKRQEDIGAGFFLS